MKVKEESEKVGLKLNIQKMKIMASSSHHFMANRWGNSGNSDRLYFGGLQNHCRWWLQPWNKRCLLLGRKAMTDWDSILKSRDITWTTKVHLDKEYGFSSNHVWMWELDHKEGWALKNWCFWSVVLGKTLESPLDCMEIKPVNPKGNQPWIFIGKTDAKAPMFWSSDAKSQLIGKDRDAEKDRGQEEKGETEDEIVGWHHWLNGCECEQALGDNEEQETKSQTWLHNWTTTRARKPPAAAAAKLLQWCLTLSDPMDCSLPGSPVHGIF